MSSIKLATFKIGLLRKCAEHGLTQEETLELVKQARQLIKQAGPIADTVSGAVSGAGNVMGSLLKNLGIYGPILALGAPPIAGYAAGRGLAHLTNVSDDDVDTIKTQELINEYKRNAEQAKNRRRTYRLPEGVSLS